MKFLYNWFKKILDTEKSTKKAPESQLAHSFGNVVVGKILEIAKHPNADRLQVTKTDVGSEVLQIVCGAPNIKVGQLVPVALVGAKLPGGMEIKEAEIRGVKSFGMLCATDELGLGSNHSGIMILNEKAMVGMEFAKYLNLNK
jgi:phenylalanyl-tRNA synthetase beta chain